MNEKLLRLKELLDDSYTGDFDYMFKFIVPLELLEELKSCLETEDIIVKPSRKGKYVSVTLKIRVQESEEVIRVYQKVAHIPGLISL